MIGFYTSHFSKREALFHRENHIGELPAKILPVIQVFDRGSALPLEGFNDLPVQGLNDLSNGPESTAAPAITAKELADRISKDYEGHELLVCDALQSGIVEDVDGRRVECTLIGGSAHYNTGVHPQ